MRGDVPDILEKGRVRHPMGYSPGELCGAFLVRTPAGARLCLIASRGDDWPFPPPAWEHVSVTARGPDGRPRDRCPTWDEMCWVKGLFWAPDEWVVQYHPAAADYVNRHPYCLHLWRPVGVDLPRPPQACVG